jgi:hypothetical protein
MGVRRPQTITITFLHDVRSERFEVSVGIHRTERFLRRFDNAGDAAQWASGWIGDRGYRWGRDTARRVDEAQRLQSPVLILEAVSHHDELARGV